MKKEYAYISALMAFITALTLLECFRNGGLNITNTLFIVYDSFMTGYHFSQYREEKNK